MSETVEQLRRVDLFAGLKPEALTLISKVATEETHALGTKIFQQFSVDFLKKGSFKRALSRLKFIRKLHI